MTNFVLIDGSYYIFYRYHALLSWYRFSHPNDDLTHPEANEEFVEKFKKTFINSIEDIIKTLKIDNPVIIIGKDCPRKDIWRMKHFTDYKSHRVADDNFMIGFFFKLVYDDEDLFYQAGANLILKHPNLEADDCLAIATKIIVENHKDSCTWIITSDLDYLQLARENVRLFNLKFKNLTESSNSFNDPKKDLFCKIVMGDKSDGIPAIFKKCGIKTAAKCYENKEFFQKKLSEGGVLERFNLNKKIIDFNEIPTNLVEDFINGNNI